MGFLLAVTEDKRLRRRAMDLAKRVWGEIRATDRTPHPLLVVRSMGRARGAAASSTVAGHVVGFVRHYGLSGDSTVEQHNLALLECMIGGRWPLDDHFGGSFCAIAFEPDGTKVAAANDPVGFYPLYVYRAPDLTVLSSSLLLTAVLSEQPIDPVGILQRLTAPRYCNFGRRTIVANVERLLPGECLSFSVADPGNTRRRFDNSLYSGMAQRRLEQAVDELWEVIRRDVALSLRFDREVIVGQSGGMDSRLVLGALGDDKSIRCFTYGESEHYETRIAKRCAALRGAAFRSFATDVHQFPERERFQDYVITTEGVVINHWAAILENADPEPDTPFLIGDLCEAVPGRNISAHTNRKSRVRNLARRVALRQDPAFTTATDSGFRRWADRQVASTLEAAERVDSTLVGPLSDEIKEAYENDLREVCSRVRENEPPYVELYDEPLSWYTNGRMTMGKQLLMLQRSFFAITPISSMKILRATCRIDPAFRCGYRLMDGLFRRASHLRTLNRIPTAQIPLVRHSMPNWIKLPAWGGRVMIDRYLLNRMITRKDPNLRYSLFPTTNWARVYQQPQAIPTIRSWLDPNRVGSERILELAERRRSLDARPLATKDITLVSGLNQELLLIESLRAADL